MRVPRITTILGVIVMHLCVTSNCHGADFDRHINKLADGTPAEQVDASYSTLWRAGKSAFPALVARLDDRTLADARFQRAEADSTGKIVDPTIGRTCLGILQGQVEGVWLRSYEPFTVLNACSAKEWFNTHRDKTLVELRNIATAESLRRAEAALKKSPDEQAYQSAVEFFRDDYDERERKRRKAEEQAPFDF